MKCSQKQRLLEVVKTSYKIIMRRERRDRRERRERSRRRRRRRWDKSVYFHVEFAGF